MVSLDNIVRRVLSRNPSLYAWARRVLVLTRFVLRRPHDPDYRAFALFPERQGLFLDIGGNAGQSALSFRLVHSGPILSVEPNPQHEADLRTVRRVLSDFDFLLAAAGEQNGTAVLRVPTYRGATITGEGTLLAEGSTGAYWAEQRLAGGEKSLGEVSREVPVCRLDELDLAPAFVKVDTEGYEIQALRGLRKTVTRHRPVVLVERSECFVEVCELFGSLGYRAARYEPRARRFAELGTAETTNVFFLP